MSDFQRIPGPPAEWKEGVEYAVWFVDTSSAVLVVNNGVVYHGGYHEGYKCLKSELSTIAEHVELPPTSVNP